MGWRGTLLHELIHIRLSEHTQGDPHGPVFTRECNRIGAVLGLPPVAEGDSWAWPGGSVLRQLPEHEIELLG